jgi:hypothetical protein
MHCLLTGRDCWCKWCILYVSPLSSVRDEDSIGQNQINLERVALLLWVLVVAVLAEPSIRQVARPVLI